MLTAIIPIDLKRRPNDLIKKAVNLVEKANKKNIKIVFGHNNSNSKHDKKLINKIKEFPQVKICSTTFFNNEVNSSQLRNLAFEAVETEFIILLDVDIHPDFDLFIKYQERVSFGLKPFYILPCLYLTSYGSNLLTNKNISSHELKEKYFSFSRKEFLHLASPSSITVLRSSDYKKLNGFDNLYTGHGFEDFDFLVRLAELHNEIEKPSDFFNEMNSRSPLFFVGFRRYLGELCIDSLLEKDLAFHLYHSKDNNENYYRSRELNYTRFFKKNNKLENSKNHKDPTLLSTFINSCNEKKLDIADYSILFENKPGHIDRYDTLKRRLKFIFNK